MWPSRPAPEREFNRRRFLALTGATAAAGAIPYSGDSGAFATPLRENQRFAADPFSLGVASGDPLPGGVVLWTRLAPEPLAPDGRGGMPAGTAVPVEWQLAEDPGFRRVVRDGVARATPELGHSVHVEVNGLRPGRAYFYRFRAGGHLSETGRTRTAPAEDARPSALSFAFLSCQSYPEGHFTALRHLADEDGLGLVVHLGDYLYEDAVPSPLGPGRDHLPATELFSLADYRVRYGQYRTDPALRAAHAAHPWAVTLDDHEVDDNWADDVDSEERRGAAVLARRAAAFQAYYENLPLRRRSLPAGPDMRMYRRLRYGGLAQFDLLDTRQYRDNQVCGSPGQFDCPDRFAPDRTMLGAGQERWLLDGLARSTATWNIMANQVVLMQGDSVAGPGRAFGMDTWDGYASARQRLIDGVRERGIENLVVLTGDAHRSVAADLTANFDDPESPAVGTEFLVTSISSGGDGHDHDPWGERWLAENPHMKFHNVRRGYAVCTLTPTALRTDYRTVPYVTRPGAPITTRATAHVTAGRPGIAQLDQ